MDWKLLLEKIENRLHAVVALVAGVILLLFIFFAGDSFFSKYITYLHLRLLYGGVLVLWCACWVFNHLYIPRNKKTKTGLVLCIYADSEEAEKNLKRDFIDTLKKQILDKDLSQIFNVITIKNHLACKYNNLESIKKLHKRTRGHIYIFGETKKRKNGEDQYFLSLDGMVLHRPIPQEMSKALAQDFLATLPKGINFNDEFAFAGFQVSADIVIKSIEYIVGIASFISGNPFLAIKVHLDLKNRIAYTAHKLPGDKVILAKIDNLLANEYAIVSAYYLGKSDQSETKNNIRLSLVLNPNCYRALIVESIMSFSWENDPKKALSILKKCHGIADPTWRYNEAFVHFWLGQYPSALKQCEKIRQQNYQMEFAISQEVTQFNEALLVATDKPVLYFWLGFNYYFKQHNLPLALKNLEIFIQRSDGAMIILKQKAVGWLVDIKREGNWK